MYGPSCPLRAELSTGRAVHGPSCPRPGIPMATVRMLPIWKRGFYNAVFSQVKCRSTRFYSLTSLGTNEQWKEDLRSELVSFLREQNRIKFGALRGTSQFIIFILSISGKKGCSEYKMNIKGSNLGMIFSNGTDQIVKKFVGAEHLYYSSNIC